MLKALTPVRKTAILLFLGLSLSYMSLGPSTVGGRGYVDEELNSGTRMLEAFNAWVKGRPVPPMLWSRHGPIPVLFDLPFIKIGKFFISTDFVLSLQPGLLTAALVTVLFLWLRKLCSPRMSLLLSLIAAFGTMLWPYAYIGLETKQSLKSHTTPNSSRRVWQTKTIQSFGLPGIFGFGRHRPERPIG